MKKMSKACAAALGAALLFSSSPILAEESDKDGSVEIELIYEEEPVIGTFEIYEVADAEVLDETSILYTYNDDFSGCTANLDKWLDEDTAGVVEEYALSNESIEPAEELYVNGENSIDLDQGLYLFVQTGAQSGMEGAQAFLVSVPMWDNDQQIFNYVIKADPKVSKKTGKDKKKESVNTDVNNDWSWYAALGCFSAGAALFLLKKLKLIKG